MLLQFGYQLKGQRESVCDLSNNCEELDKKHPLTDEDAIKNDDLFGVSGSVGWSLVEPPCEIFKNLKGIP